jgi:hypothetical protein
MAECMNSDTAAHVVRHDPARVRAGIEPKRNLVNYLADQLDQPDSAHDVATVALRLLALEFAGHPDYHEEWRP